MSGRPPDPLERAFAGRSVAVVGATGFIGRAVARALAGRGAAVCLLARDRAAAQGVGSELGGQADVVACDVGAPGEIEAALGRLRPAVTFNLAGYGVDPLERYEASAELINALFPERLCVAVARRRDPAWTGRALVHVGTALEYGRATGSLAEDTPEAPDTLYGRSKLAGTRALARLCPELGLPAVTARLFTVYGPGEHAGRLLPSLLRAAAAGSPLELTSGEQQRDFTYVGDVAEGLLRLALLDPSAAPPGAVVNLATGTLTSVRAFAERAAAVLGIPPEHLHFGRIPTRDSEMRHDPVSIDRLRTLTGWAPATGIEEGVRRTALAASPPLSA